MYIYIYIYIYIHVYTCTAVYRAQQKRSRTQRFFRHLSFAFSAPIILSTGTRMHGTHIRYAHAHVRTYSHTHAPTQMCACLYAHSHTYTHTHKHIHTHTIAHTHTHTHTHKHTHTHTHTHWNIWIASISAVIIKKKLKSPDNLVVDSKKSRVSKKICLILKQFFIVLFQLSRFFPFFGSNINCLYASSLAKDLLWAETSPHPPPYLVR